MLIWLCVCACVWFLRSYVWLKPHEIVIADGSYDNPEGHVRNIEMNEAAIRRRLETAFEKAHPKLGVALDRARVRAEFRNPAGMTELIQRGAVQHIGGGTFNVVSATGGGNYKVQVDLTKTELSVEGAAALVLSCECREHIMKKGPSASMRVQSCTASPQKEPGGAARSLLLRLSEWRAAARTAEQGSCRLPRPALRAP